MQQIRRQTLDENWVSFLRFRREMWVYSQITLDLSTFTEEVFKGKHNFLGSETS